MIITLTVHPALDRVLRVRALTAHEANRASVEREYAGGKGNNAARALRRLGAGVTATGFQGGHSGDFCTHDLDQIGVRTTFLRSRAPTRLSQLLIVSQTGAVYPIYEPGQPVPPEEAEALVSHLPRLLSAGDLCLLCGTSVVPDLIARLTTQARQAGATVWLDSSGPALQHSLRAGPHLVKVNAHELAEALDRSLPDRAALAAAVRELSALTGGWVAVTAGADGLLLAQGDRLIHAHLPMSRVVNTVGCGDSLLAGMAWRFSQGHDLIDLARWGVACGAANTQSIGAGYIDPDLVRVLAERVEVVDVA
jgi:1-phosphofructokinase family hexose kinase